MEGLTKRDKNLKIIPGLAERWEIVEPTRWRFYLRKGVKFHDGEDFTADDVLFSVERMRSDGSTAEERVLPADIKAVKVDDHTVDFVLARPNPILNAEWDTWYILSKKWSEADRRDAGAIGQASVASAWALTTNGTGPFIVASHEPGVQDDISQESELVGKARAQSRRGDLHHHQVGRDPRRGAAHRRGRLIEPVPVQDMERITRSPTTTVMTGPELRTIFLDFDSFRDELKYASIKGKNPFKDARVRKAFYQAVDDRGDPDQGDAGDSRAHRRC